MNGPTVSSRMLLVETVVCMVHDESLGVAPLVAAERSEALLFLSPILALLFLSPILALLLLSPGLRDLLLAFDQNKICGSFCRSVVLQISKFMT